MTSTQTAAPATVSARRAQRGVPDPGIQLPRAAVPTVALFAGSLVLWAFATWLVLGAHASAWVTVPLHAVVTFTMFTVAHESMHHAAGRWTWVNTLLGWLSVPFVAPYVSFPAFRFIHIEHHRYTNENLSIDPDMWTSHGPRWQAPVRWASLDLAYIVFYVRAFLRRPAVERTVEALVFVAAIAATGWAFGAGYGWEVAVIVYLPQRIGQTLLAWLFDWYPHHDLTATNAEDPYRTTRNRIGAEWLFNAALLYQNYHAMHHLHPAIPFYRYVDAWKANTATYLDRGLPISTPWGHELTAGEYVAWRGLTESLTSADADGFHRLAVAQVRPLTADSAAITFDVPAELRDRYAFTAGQHVIVRRVVDGGELRRTYSICAPADSGVLRIGVRRIADGRMSSWLTEQVGAGDLLDVSTPTGRFTLVPRAGEARHHVGIAAGSGITPVLSMLATALSVDEQSRFTLLYGNRSAASTMFADELIALQRQFGDRLTVLEYRDELDTATPGVLAGPIGAAQITDLLAGSVAADDVDGWYICGPEPMLDAVRGALRGGGVAEDRIHFELFRAAAQPVPARSGTPCVLTASVGGESVTVDADAEQTVLEALLDSRVPAPYSCMGGACGTCRAKVTHGHATMDQNSALSDTEIEAGYVLTCQARATTQRLDVDYNA